MYKKRELKKELEQEEDKKMETNVKIYFENKSIQKRIDFIEDYDFENDFENRDYFISVIKNTELTSNHYYNALIIDISNKLQIKDLSLFKKYMDYLIHPNDYFTKLMLLDYFLLTYELYSSNDLDYFFLHKVLENKYERLIVKNQTLINLILFYPENKEDYIKQLIRSMKKTFDYRSHIRVLNNIMNYNLNSLISYDQLNQLVFISSSMDLGRAVDLALTDFRDFIKA